jgi:hypothetical protein
MKTLTTKIGSEQKHRGDKKDTPGPGAYEIKTQTKKGVTISGVHNKK